MRFSVTRTPHLEFGPGAVMRVPAILGDSFRRIALVTGASSFAKSSRGAALREALCASGTKILEYACPGEPSVDFVDTVVRSLLEVKGEVDDLAVVAVGGGSAIDAGKAVAAMLRTGEESTRRGDAAPSVAEFLEGVGSRSPAGETAFFVACPTTAGTGSEATKNAVISRIGDGGFKKSLRHENYIPRVAVVDPELAIGCPRSVSAAGGLDALTQLIEAWTSPSASPIIDSLCESGIAAFARSFDRVLRDGSDLEARGGMAYAAYLSGVALANAGLGAVHGLASPLGGRFPVPHGVVCGILLEGATRLNVRRLEELGGNAGEQARAALRKYARTGYILASRGGSSISGNPALAGETVGAGRVESLSFGLGLLFDELSRLSALAGLPRLGSYGIAAADLAAIASASSAKTNPVPLAPADYEGLLQGAL